MSAEDSRHLGYVLLFLSITERLHIFSHQQTFIFISRMFSFPAKSKTGIILAYIMTATINRGHRQSRLALFAKSLHASGDHDKNHCEKALWKPTPSASHPHQPPSCITFFDVGYALAHWRSSVVFSHSGLSLSHIWGYGSEKWHSTTPLISSLQKYSRWVRLFYHSHVPSWFMEH